MFFSACQPKNYATILYLMHFYFFLAARMAIFRGFDGVWQLAKKLPACVIIFCWDEWFLFRLAWLALVILKCNVK